MADGLDDELAAKAWRDIADASERLTRRSDSRTATDPAQIAASVSRPFLGRADAVPDSVPLPLADGTYDLENELSDAASALVYEPPPSLLPTDNAGVKPISPTRQLGGRALWGCGLPLRLGSRLAGPGPIAGLLGGGPGTGLLGADLGTDLLGAGLRLSDLAGGTSASRLLGCRFRCRCYYGYDCRLCRSATKPNALGESRPPFGIVGSRRRWRRG